MDTKQLKDSVIEKLNASGKTDLSDQEIFVVSFLVAQVVNLERRPDDGVKSGWKRLFEVDFQKKFQTVSVTPVLILRLFDTVLVYALDIKCPQQQPADNPVLISGYTETSERKKLLLIAGAVGFLVLILFLLSVFSNLLSNQTPQPEQPEQVVAEWQWQEVVVIVRVDGAKMELLSAPDDGSVEVATVSTQVGQPILAYLDPSTDWAKFARLPVGQPKWTTAVYEGEMYFRLGENYAVLKSKETGELISHAGFNSSPAIISAPVQPAVSVSTPANFVAQIPQVTLLSPKAGAIRRLSMPSNIANGTFEFVLFLFIVFMVLATVVTSVIQGDKILASVFVGSVGSVVIYSVVIQRLITVDPQWKVIFEALVCFIIIPGVLFAVSRLNPTEPLTDKHAGLGKFLALIRTDVTTLASYILLLALVDKLWEIGVVRFVSQNTGQLWIVLVLVSAIVIYGWESSYRTGLSFVLQITLVLVVYFVWFLILPKFPSAVLIPRLAVCFLVLLGVASVMFGQHVRTSGGIKGLVESRHSEFAERMEPDSTRVRVALFLDYIIDPFGAITASLFLYSLVFMSGDVMAILW